jgi:RHS repeat-associated protein
VAIITGSAFAAIPAVLPEFKNEKQLAEWRAEMAAKHAAASTASADHAFYTGKPYIESTGSYAFKYRSYNPDLARWTSEDPSGFPDGANGSIYAPTPTSCIDFEGLWRIKLTSSGDGLAIYGGGPGTYTWQDKSGPLTAKAQIQNLGAQGDIRSSWTFLTVGTATHTGVTGSKQVIAMYTVSVRENGTLFIENQTGTCTNGANLNASSAANFTGIDTGELSLVYEVAGLYNATGIKGFNVQYDKYGGGLSWDTATYNVKGFAPTVTFKVVE